MRTAALSVLALLVLSGPAAGQQSRPDVPPARLDDSPFRPLDLPTPSATRSASGQPGAAYWQQRVDYVIHATLDTTARVLRGEERITYTNQSPDTLRFLWLQLDQNLFRPDSRGALITPAAAMRDPDQAATGMTITRVATGARRSAPLRHLVTGTMMRVDLAEPLPPGGQTRLEVDWSFPFLEEGPNRMGIEFVDDGWIFEVAQWYPRLAVYDDVRGWNTEPYLGSGEFYLEYGRFDVSLTVPGNMLVAATGELQNPREVLTSAQRTRLEQARRSEATVVIRGVDEVSDPATRPDGGRGELTWRFVADSVRDFAWAAAKHFVWDAASAADGRVLAMSFYPPSADSIWRESTQYVRFAVERYGEQWWPYPYPYAINVNGIEGGMEYPMIVFCANRRSAPALFSVTDHEIAHMWFPMLVGNNERLHPWMDEGFNTFMNYYNWAEKYPDRDNRRGSLEGYLATALVQGETPVSTPPDRSSNVGHTAYNKPGVALRLLREVVLGAERFDPAFQEYIRRWAYRHPTPADFFRTMQDVTGEDLAWFWRGWIYSTATFDVAVDSVTARRVGTRPLQLVHLGLREPMVMPVDLELTYADGRTARRRVPVEAWMRGPVHRIVLPGEPVLTRVVADPDGVLPDIWRGNNGWGAAP